MIRFNITTLGCKVNQYDSAALAARLQQSGLTPAEADIRPDLVVINTCCVTATAMRKSRQAIRKQLRDNTDATVLVTGCYSDYDTEAVAQTIASLGVPIHRVHVTGHHGDLADVIRKVLANLRANGSKSEQAADAIDALREAERELWANVQLPFVAEQLSETLSASMK